MLTGATGFIGKVILEKILRTTEPRVIYLLVRPKKGKSDKQRMSQIFESELFSTLFKLKPALKVNWSK